MTAYQVLLIEDNPGDARLVREMLAREPRTPVELHCAATLREGLERLEGGAFDAVVVDLGLPDSNGLETFTHLHQRFPSVPAVVLTGMDDVDLATCAVQVGAEDYLVKGTLDGMALTRAVRHAVERQKAKEAVRRSEATLRSVFENSPLLMGVVELTGDDTIIHVRDNPVTAKFFARAYGDTAARNAADLGAPDEAVRIWAAHYRLAEREQRPVAFEYRHPAGRNEMWLSVHVSPIGPGPSGRTQFCYVAEEITERKEADAAIRQHADELARSNAALQRFNRLGIGRELRMIELKKEINALCLELGRPPRYAGEHIDSETHTLPLHEMEVSE